MGVHCGGPRCKQVLTWCADLQGPSRWVQTLRQLGDALDCLHSILVSVVRSSGSAPVPVWGPLDCRARPSACWPPAMLVLEPAWHGFKPSMA